MTLATSGEMSIGGSTANRSINLELSLGATANSSLGQANFRSLAGVSAGTISMSNFYGKSAISLASLTSVYGTANPGGIAYAEITFYSDGTINYGSSSGSGTMGRWGSSGIGASYWINCIQTSSYGTSTVYGAARSTWLQLSSNYTYGIQRTANGAGGRTYTFQISSNSSGSNIVATATGIAFDVEIIF